MSKPRRRRRWALAAAHVGLITLALASAASAPAAEIYGYVQEGLAVRTGEGDVIFHRQLLNIKAQEKLGRRLSLRFQSDFWVDEPDFQGVEMRSRVREAYAKLRFEDFDVRVGRVQIAWGEADGIIISDQVSPFDLENFIVPPFDEIRLGVDGVFVDYYLNLRSRVQLLYISHFTPPDFANRQSPWSFFDEDDLTRQIRDQAPPGTPPLRLEIAPFDRPKNEPANYEAGVRYASQARALDWQVGYLYSYDDRPHVRLRATGVDPTTVPPTIVATGFPRHNRFHLFTGSFVVPVRSVLLKLDTAFEHGRFLQLNPADPSIDFVDPDDPAVIAGFVTEEDVSRTLVAVDFKPDFSWWHQADAQVQFIHESVIDPHPALLTSEHTDLVSIRLQAAYLNETVKPWIFAIANVRGDDTWVQAKIDWEPIDRWRFTVEYDWFDGHEDDGDNGGTFGRFDENDMFLFIIRYSY